MIYLVSKTLFKLDTCALLQHLIRGGFSKHTYGARLRVAGVPEEEIEIS